MVTAIATEQCPLTYVPEVRRLSCRAWLSCASLCIHTGSGRLRYTAGRLMDGNDIARHTFVDAIN
ncbi:hypothetical protein BOTBODRAFT_53425 [Botryobasidium botryosum FD-172 SS1]|uniref:Uncharacterized protein n=1 Tax=Botryobasidium botryosum (strain FD-172 SS1) TaxID=930990 RepID=A0A067MZJ7_BOTB1|nr:hypothetical protein BOTBODRAFT_53425 [Botryobasidium botryosum FD-172 SS1]